MPEDRTALGRRVLGYRRLRVPTLVTAALLLAGLWASAPASAKRHSSGGAGFGPPPNHGPRAHKAQANPFRSRGMWIWYISASENGNLGAIIGKAHRYGVKVLMIKSGDGSGTWSQFNHQLVRTLHANGLRVCGWQYVYGSDPVGEAQAGAAAARDGADCFVIDAESEYESVANNYVQAQTYIGTLRRLIGGRFPVALAGFPYMDFHQSFPYSVFLGPGAAQYNVPQMYWVDIGDSVDQVYAHTYQYNRLYGRTISPLGQVYNSPAPRDIVRFRQVSLAYGAPGVSWWDWQEATRTAWHALAVPIGRLANFTPDSSVATLSQGDQGDLVVWAQEHLRSAGQRVAVDGNFSGAMQLAVRRFQAAHRIATVGYIGPQTWQALLRYPAARVHWRGRRASALRAASDTAGTPVPISASLPAKRYEIPPSLGAGAGPH